MVPSVTTQPRHTTAIIKGKSVPKPRITWSGKNKSKHGEVEIRSINNTHVSSWLAIRKTGRRDARKYVCIAQNDLKNVEEVVVQLPATFKMAVIMLYAFILQQVYVTNANHLIPCLTKLTCNWCLHKKCNIIFLFFVFVL